MSNEKKIRIMACLPGLASPLVSEVSDDLETFQKLVGGYIEILALPGSIDLVLNEEGALIELPVCRLVEGRAPLLDPDMPVINAPPDAAAPGETGWHVIHGAFFLARHDGEGNLTSLADDDIRKLRPLFAHSHVRLADLEAAAHA